MAEQNPASEIATVRFVAAVLDAANEQRLKVAQPGLLKLHALRREVFNMSVQMTAKKRLALAKSYEARLGKITGALAKVEQEALAIIDDHLSEYRSIPGVEASNIDGAMLHGAFVSIALPRPIGRSPSGAA